MHCWESPLALRRLTVGASRKHSRSNRDFVDRGRQRYRTDVTDIYWCIRKSNSSEDFGFSWAEWQKNKHKTAGSTVIKVENSRTLYAPFRMFSHRQTREIITYSVMSEVKQKDTMEGCMSYYTQRCVSTWIYKNVLYHIIQFQRQIKSWNVLYYHTITLREEIYLNCAVPEEVRKRFGPTPSSMKRPAGGVTIAVTRNPSKPLH